MDQYEKVSLERHLQELMAERDRRYLDLLEERDRRYEERFTASGRATDAAFAASQRAIDKAEGAQHERNVVANEFRATLADQAATFLPIKESEVRFTRIEEAIKTCVQAPMYDAAHRALVEKVDQMRIRLADFYTIQAADIHAHEDMVSHKQFSDALAEARGRQALSAVIASVISALVVGLIVAFAQGLLRR